jgi:hypothetical protein
VLHDPAKLLPTLTLAKPTSAVINQAFNVTGTLSSALTPVPASQQLSVVRDSTYGTVALPSVATGSNGSFLITDTVTKRGDYGYTVTWDGDADHASRSARVVVPVHGVAPTVSVTTSAGPYAFGTKVALVAHMGAATPGTVSIFATPYGTYGAGIKSLLKTGVPNAAGDVAVYYTIVSKTLVTATFNGDTHFDPGTATKYLSSRAKIYDSFAHYSGTSGSYKIYKPGGLIEYDVKVAPVNGGACMSFVLQTYSSGSWHTRRSVSCDRLDSLSKSRFFGYPKDFPGLTFRVRTVFKGSAYNVATAGAWRYGKVTN